MLDSYADKLSDPANLLVMACLTGAVVMLILHQLVTVRKRDRFARRGQG